MRRLPETLLALALLFGARAARAESVRTVDAPRIVVSDVVTLDDGGDVELGPAPPPGSSRLVERREVLTALRAAGIVPAKFVMPASVRVVRAAERRSSQDLAAEATPLVRKALPPGVALVSLRFTRGVVVPPSAAMTAAALPALPHHAGPLHTTVFFDFRTDGETVTRAAAAVVLDVSAEAAAPDVVRGTRLDVVIAKGAARISAVGSALADGDVGDVISVRIDSTQKILEARVESRERAVVVRP